MNYFVLDIKIVDVPATPDEVEANIHRRKEEAKVMLKTLLHYKDQTDQKVILQSPVSGCKQVFFIPVSTN